MSEPQNDNFGKSSDSVESSSTMELRNVELRNRARSSLFKYYIHDSIDTCRLQLLGELSEVDTPELIGCWRTAKTTLGNRKLVLDLRGLKTADVAGKDWLNSMAVEGAVYLPESYLRSGLNRQATSDSEPLKPGFFTKLISVFRGTRVMPAESSTQAQ
jgi:hypothetical protein